MTTPPETSPIDFQMLHHLEEIMGSETCLMLLQQFIAYAPEQYEQLKQAFERQDYEHLRYKSHQFKGECLQMGATLVGQACKELEEKAKTMQTKNIESCLQKLHYETQRAIAELEQAH
ncbi:Hpt domain-containing protein [Candidatus Albibeggiatoa sp. nov. NOAA]|uniref:Hpt domain-containing protein n=1 Tax=Candidatus Albibeggiatoa sp. nov. NOAA TaxID=3162724 RepID=UPI0032F568F0|nr:Hpt domain-containing protein [Thiotrichaceae bacterium]